MVDAPRAPFLAAPLRLDERGLRTVTWERSIQAWIELNLNAARQDRERPRWLPADPSLGRRTPLDDLVANGQPLMSDPARIKQTIRVTVLSAERRVTDVKTELADSPTRQPASGALSIRALVRCELVTGTVLDLPITGDLKGRAPVFRRGA